MLVSCAVLKCRGGCLSRCSQENVYLGDMQAMQVHFIKQGAIGWQRCSCSATHCGDMLGQVVLCSPFAALFCCRQMTFSNDTVLEGP